MVHIFSLALSLSIFRVTISIAHRSVVEGRSEKRNKMQYLGTRGSSCLEEGERNGSWGEQHAHARETREGSVAAPRLGPHRRVDLSIQHEQQFHTEPQRYKFLHLLIYLFVCFFE